MYLDIRTIVGLLAIAGCQQNYIATYRLPRVFVHRVNFQRPKRYVSVGALDEVKPDVQGLGRLHQVLDLIPSR